METKRQLVKKIFITAKLTALTGLRIGDNKENVEIGGVDNPVVRRKDNQEPYVPGSSIKGKIRSLLELATGKNPDSKSQNDGSTVIERLFGAGENTGKIGRLETEKKQRLKDIEQEEAQALQSAGEEEKDAIKAKAKEERDLVNREFKEKRSQYEGIQSRLIVRDAYLTRIWAKKLKDSEHTDMPYTEIKWENVINRLKGTAEHPRQMERVPAGAEFELNFIINVFSNDQGGEREYIDCLKSGLELLRADYLGGSGSRGYGQVQIDLDVEPVVKEIREYLSEGLISAFEAEEENIESQENNSDVK